MARIRCPRCGESESFSVVIPLHVVVDIDGTGNQTGGADYGNESGPKTIRCECGHAWRTRRHLDFAIDVR